MTLPGQEVCLPNESGTEDEHGIDISSLQDQTVDITIAPGSGNTGACGSGIRFIDGEQGVLRYHGDSIEELAKRRTFMEVAWLLTWGELPTSAQLSKFRSLLTEQELSHEGMRYHFEDFPPHGATEGTGNSEKDEKRAEHSTDSTS